MGVEDENEAPRDDFIRIHGEIQQQLDSMTLEGVDTEPIPRFESLITHLDFLRTQIPEKDESLIEAFTFFAESLRASPLSPRRARLIHQDDHPANVMCSKSKSGPEWVLDAVIDWESAAIADPRSTSDAEP